MQLFHFTHTDPEIDTVFDLLKDPNSPAFLYGTDPNGFLNVLGEENPPLTNRQRIEATYTLNIDKGFIGATYDKMPLKVGTLIYIDRAKINQETFLTEGIEIVSTNEPAFKAYKLAQLEADKGYYQVNNPVHGQQIGGISKESYPDVSVWIWCRSLSKKIDETGELKGEIFNLSPFISKLQTSSTKNGGNFSFSLPPLVCELDSENKWIIKAHTIDQYSAGNNNSLQGDGYVAQSSIYHVETFQENPNKASDDYLVRNQFLFHNIIGSNDLVFIRFETLEMEKDQRYSDAKEYYVHKNLLANRIYDMIGLVDGNTQSVNPSNNDVTINVSGKDLSKLFIEDGTNFFALENSQGVLKYSGQSTLKNSLLNRIFATSGLNFLGLYMFNSIEYILKFVIQQLSNIQIVPSDLFTSYENSINQATAIASLVTGKNITYDSRNRTYTDFGKSAKDASKTDNFNSELMAGIWQIVDLVIDKSVSQRRLADASFSTANGSLLNFIRSACQEPLVEFYMDTYGDRYNLIVRKPPYDQQALISLIEGKVSTEKGMTIIPPAIVTVRAEDVLQEVLSYNDDAVYSWYHFFPKSNLIGDAQNHSLSYLGAIYFEEYAKIWGSKAFQQTHSYTTYNASTPSGKAGVQKEELQAIEDMKYVIESNQYLPFTRKGTLTLNRDRRLKIGNILRYESTGEIFFIEAVQHSFSVTENSIDAVTVVQVSRGMIEQLIYGVDVVSDNGKKHEYVGYFNLINTELHYEYRKELVDKIDRKKIAAVQTYSTVTKDITLPSMFMIDDFYEGSFVKQKGNIGLDKLSEFDQFPQHKNIFIKFINKINDSGYRVAIASAVRSPQQQKNIRNGHESTSGKTLHTSGLAIDINVINDRTGVQYMQSHSIEKWQATGVPALAISMGLQWGDSRNIGTFYKNGNPFGNIDRSHFQIVTQTLKTKNEIIAEHYEEVITKVSVSNLDRSKIFKNFKVDNFCLNWFLKKSQNSPEYRNVTSRLINKNGAGDLSNVTIISHKKKPSAGK